MFIRNIPNVPESMVVITTVSQNLHPIVDRVTKKWPTGGPKAIRQHPNVDTNATAKRPFVSALDGLRGFSDLVQIYHGHFGRFLSDLKKMNTSFQQVDLSHESTSFDLFGLISQFQGKTRKQTQDSIHQKLRTLPTDP